MISNELFNFVFRTLDTLEDAKSKLDKVMGRTVKLPYSWSISKKEKQSVVVSKQASQSNSIYLADRVYTSGVTTEKLIRKVKPKSGKAFKSLRAEKVQKTVKQKDTKILVKGATISGKKTVAQVVWALGHANKAGVKEGLSLHDMSSLLDASAGVKLYPVNVSRVVHHNNDLIKLSSQEKRTKRYALTDAGIKAFQNLA